MMGAYPGVIVDARRGTRELSQACSVEAARTASAVRGDQDHEDRDHCQRQTYSQPHLPVPLSPSVDPARVVPPRTSFQGLFVVHQDALTGPPLSSRLATISHPGRPDFQDTCVLLPSAVSSGPFELVGTSATERACLSTATSSISATGKSPGVEIGHLEATYPMVRRDGRQSGASGRSRSRWSSRSAR